jgi:colanic acid/amylovoran biosynthesis protein
MSSAKTFLFIGNGSTANRGCEAILLSTIDMLEVAFSGSTFINCSYKDDRIGEAPYLRRSNLIHRPHPPRRTIRGILWQFRKRMFRHRFNFQGLLTRADAVFALGGDNYSLDYGVPMEFFRANEVVVNAKKPLVLWGASVGPFTSKPDFERYAREKLKRVDLICARESQTIEYLDSLGIRDNVCRVVDPAFILEPEEPTLSPEEHKILERPHIGLNLSPLLARYREYRKPWPEHAADLAAHLFTRTRYPIALVPHVMQSRNNDYEFLKGIRDQLPKQRDRLVLVGPNYSCRQYKWLISKCLVFAGARTHATIAALSSRVPTLSLSYSMKSIGINEDLFGSRMWAVALSELDPPTFSDRISELIMRAEEVRRYLQAVMPDYIKRAYDAVPRLANMLKQSP